MIRVALPECVQPIQDDPYHLVTQA
ncbi:hypothetical protein LCGC14_1634330, partial [marine sediment metagenome]